DPVGVGTVTVTARSSGLIAQPIATQQVTVSAPGITVGARTVGAGLQESTSFSLGASNHGGVMVTVTSSDPTRVLVSPDASTPGSGSFSVNMADGNTGLGFYVQGVEGATGTASVTVSAAGFNQGSATMTVVQPGIILAGLSSSTTTLSPDNHFYAYVGIPSGSSVNAQSVRAGGSPIAVTFAVDDPAVAVLETSLVQDDTVTATIVPGLYYTPSSVASGGVAFDPVGVGTVTVTARSSGLIAQPIATQQVTVSAPGITVGARTVGAGLQESTSFSLGASNHGGVTVTVTSSDATRVLVSPDASTPGSGSFSVNMADGNTGLGFYVQGVEGATGTASVTVSAAGFNQGSATMTVVQPGIILAGLSASATTLSPDNQFYAYVGIPSGSSVNAQNVRAGGSPITVTFAVDNPGVAVLETSLVQDDTVTATIVPGLYYTPSSVASGGVAFDPVGVGTVTVTARSSGLIAQPIATQQVTVSAPGITVGARTVGAGLQESTSFSLGASNHGGVMVTVTSSDPTTLLVSPNSTTPGSGSFSVNMADGNTGLGFYVQGVEGATGAATVTVSAAGFLDGTAVETVAQPGLILVGLNSTLASGATNTQFYAYAGVPVGSSVNAQSVRAGSAGVTVTAMSSNAAAALVVTSAGAGASGTAVIVPGLYYTPTTLSGGGFELDPLAPGTTTVSVSAPGFLTQPLGMPVVNITP
ncbi:MAG: beta strand repeat-containing protein, partial [Gemmatimonadales bacterium]